MKTLKQLEEMSTDLYDVISWVSENWKELHADGSGSPGAIRKIMKQFDLYIDQAKKAYDQVMKDKKPLFQNESSGDEKILVKIQLKNAEIQKLQQTASRDAHGDYEKLQKLHKEIVDLEKQLWGDIHEQKLLKLIEAKYLAQEYTKDGEDTKISFDASDDTAAIRLAEKESKKGKKFIVVSKRKGDVGRDLEKQMKTLKNILSEIKITSSKWKEFKGKVDTKPGSPSGYSDGIVDIEGEWIFDTSDEKEEGDSYIKDSIHDQVGDILRKKKVDGKVNITKISDDKWKATLMYEMKTLKQLVEDSAGFFKAKNNYSYTIDDKEYKIVAGKWYKHTRSGWNDDSFGDLPVPKDGIESQKFFANFGMPSDKPK